MKTFIVTIICCFFSNFIFAQKAFKIKFLFPKETSNQVFTISYDDGNRWTLVNINKDIDSVEINGVFYSRYLKILIDGLVEKEIFPFYLIYLSEGGEGTVEIVKSLTNDNQKFTLKLTNVINQKDVGEGTYNDLITKDIEEILHLREKYLQFPQDSLQKQIALVGDIIEEKTFNFIRQNSKTYFASYLFDRQIGTCDYSIKELIVLFNKIFDESFISSHDGQRILKKLNTLAIGKGHQVQPIRVTDIYGDIITFPLYQKKFTLLYFGAPWCESCVEKIPAIKEIRKRYKTTDLEIISMAADEDSTHLIDYINRNQLYWTHVLDKEDKIISEFGDISIPKIFLINKEGKIEYTMEEEEDYDLKKLNTLLSLHLSKNK